MLQKVGCIGEVTFELSLERDDGLCHGDIHGKIILAENSQFRGLKCWSERPIERPNGGKRGGGRLRIRWGCTGYLWACPFPPSDMGSL